MAALCFRGPFRHRVAFLAAQGLVAVVLLTLLAPSSPVSTGLVAAASSNDGEYVEQEESPLKHGVRPSLSESSSAAPTKRMGKRAKIGTVVAAAAAVMVALLGYFAFRGGKGEGGPPESDLGERRPEVTATLPEASPSEQPVQLSRVDNSAAREQVFSEDAQ